MILFGTIKNSVRLAALDSQWQQKKQSAGKKELAELTAEERSLLHFQEQADSIREARKPAEIDAKLQSGARLTPEEIEYLRRTNPQALKEYEEIRRERESYRRQLRGCRSKEEVEKLKLTKTGQYLAAAKKIANDPYIPKSQKCGLMKKLLKELSAVEAEHEKFLLSLKYARLPQEEKEARKKASEEDPQTDQTDPDARKVPCGPEDTDAAEELRRMAEAFSKDGGAPAGVEGTAEQGQGTVEGTDTADRAIDLKI